MATRWLVLALLCAAATGCAPAVPVAGLRPESPKASRVPIKVESLQPTLSWEAFPRAQDAIAGTLSEVRYDLRIWRQDNGRLELVYERRGLPEPSHTVETPLQPRTDYLWSVRARFLLDGRPRVIEWSGVVWRNDQVAADLRRTELVAPDGSVPALKQVFFQHHRFKTPREETR